MQLTDGEDDDDGGVPVAVAGGEGPAGRRFVVLGRGDLGVRA
jgi:hypothetical protein